MVSPGGIILSADKELKPYGKVLAIGSEVKDVKVGMYVYYIPQTSIRVEYKGKKYSVIEEKNVIAELVE
jgi:co-chaperonin GroES (HSP10)